MDIPFEACDFYRGYYDASVNMGTLFFRIAIIYLILEFSTRFLTFFFDYLKKRGFNK